MHVFRMKDPEAFHAALGVDKNGNTDVAGEHVGQIEKLFEECHLDDEAKNAMESDIKRYVDGGHDFKLGQQARLFERMATSSLQDILTRFSE